jgi:predicted SAM-dependent methyltransferase
MSQNNYTRDELIEADGTPVTLNLGCGTDRRGVGIDLNYDTADISADLNKGIPVEDSAVDHIIIEHVLEHIENPSRLLREMHRVLCSDGTGTIEVPNAGWLPVRLYLTQDIHQLWAHKDPNTKGHWLARRLGNPDPDRTAHLTLWSKALLRDHLERAGFEYEFVNSKHWSRNIRAKIKIPDK